MDGKSLNVTDEKINNLKKIFPEAFTEGKIDWEKLKAALGEDIEFRNERYVLNWAGKSDAFRVLQAPTTATLIPCKEESVNFDDTGNIFVEGENLEVLKILQKSYFGKIKMIDIDPPYNTGNDNFIYPDKFSETKEEYLERIGDKDEAGYMTREGLFRKNSKDSGHYHSNWLSMMYPRLFLARNLLREDGVIFVSIDDNEVHNLRMLMNEVFGEENFVAQFVWRSRLGKGGTSNQVALIHEYVLAYARDFMKFEFRKDVKVSQGAKERLRQWGQGDSKEDRPSMYYPIPGPDAKDVFPIKPDGTHGRWRVGKAKMTDLLSCGLVKFEKREGGHYEAYKIIEAGKETFSAIDSILSNEKVLTTAAGSKEVKSLFDNKQYFDYPKPSALLNYLIGLLLDKESLILDFFSGSCTTAHAVLDLNKEDGGNRKFICIQLPEKCDEKSEAYKAGYKTIAEIGKERIRRVIKKIKEEEESKQPDLFSKDKPKQDLGFKVFKLQKSNFKIWRPKVKNEEELFEQLTFHTDPVDENAEIENILYELLLKSGIPLTAGIEDKEGYYLANDGEIVLMLEKVDEEIIKAVMAEKPKKVITLDRLFKNNDQLKTNTALQMKDAGIEFKSV